VNIAGQFSKVSQNAILVDLVAATALLARNRYGVIRTFGIAGNCRLAFLTLTDFILLPLLLATE
jgi:hypothetical protein